MDDDNFVTHINKATPDFDKRRYLMRNNSQVRNNSIAVYKTFISYNSNLKSFDIVFIEGHTDTSRIMNFYVGSWNLIGVVQAFLATFNLQRLFPPE